MQYKVHQNTAGIETPWFTNPNFTQLPSSAGSETLSNGPFPESDEWNKNIRCPWIQQKQVGTVTSQLTNTPLTRCYGHRLFQPASSSRCSPVSALIEYHSHPCRVGCGEEGMRGGSLEGPKPKYTKDFVSPTSIKTCGNGILISPAGSMPKVFRTAARKS